MVTTSTEDIPRRPRVFGARSLTDLTVSEWSIPSTRTALRQHCDGDFNRSALLADAMRGDERIAADLRTRVHAVTGLPFRIEPSPLGDQRRAKAIADELAAGWPRIIPPALARSFLRPAIMMGFAYGPCRWRAEGGRWWPQPEVWHPQHARYDAVSDRLQTQTTTGMADVVPGDGTWLLYEPEGARSWTEAAVRGLAIPYQMRTRGRVAWGRFNERHGLPIIGAVVPEEADKDDKDDFFADLRTLGSEGVVLLPKDKDGSGFDLEMIEPKNVQAWKSFEGIDKHCCVSIAVAFLGQANNATEGGSYAKATALDLIRQDLLESDATGLAAFLRDQMLRPWARFNFGDADLAPILIWDATPPEDTSRLVATLSTAGTALTAWQAAAAEQGFEVDVEALAKRLDMPLKRLTRKPS